MAAEIADHTGATIGLPATGRQAGGGEGPEGGGERGDGELDRDVARGEIAEELVISLATVKTHIRHLLQKLGLRDRVQAVVLAHEHGLV